MAGRFPPTPDARASGVDARASGVADSPEYDMRHQQQQPVDLWNQMIEAEKRLASRLEDGAVRQLVEPNEDEENEVRASDEGHCFTLGSENKGASVAYRKFQENDFLSSPAAVLLVQDTAPFDDHVFLFARVCGVGGFSDGGDADVLACWCMVIMVCMAICMQLVMD